MKQKISRKVLMPLPRQDFDPTEAAVPWKILSENGIEVTFATPDGAPGVCDQRMLKGIGLGPMAVLLAADKKAREVYSEMSLSVQFNHPLKWDELEAHQFDGILFSGGHAQGMREYLESNVLQKITAKFFELNKPVGAICHGVVLVARSQNGSNQSVLFGRRTTALLASQEMTAWLLTCTWLGNYYRTYSQTVEAEVRAALSTPDHFIKGPIPLFRDSQKNLTHGFVVQDGNYLSARWPGDAHLFGMKYLEMVRKV